MSVLTALHLTCTLLIAGEKAQERVALGLSAFRGIYSCLIESFDDIILNC